MEIGFLGPLQLEGDVSLSPRARVVLAALVVRRGEVVSPDRLADAVWRESPPQSWAKQVQICVWSLRKELGRDVVETVDGGYRLTASVDDLDVSRFEALLDRGRDLAATGEAERAASTFDNALNLWRGPPFGDLDGWMPGRIEVARLEELHRTAEEDVVEARLAAGEHRDVVAEAATRAADEPLRERRWALLALAQYRCGQQGDALRSLRRARQVLVEQLGVDPGPELAALETSILGHDPALLVSDPHRVASRCPYKGLAPYDVDDADTFFGRDDDVAACLTRLRDVRLLVVAGPSGSGKSSLVRAGVVPVLQRRHLAVVVLVPGANPDGALSAALATSPGRPLVVVDQLEELFAASSTPEGIRAFCARLAAYAAERAPVIVTVRSDHLGNLAAEPTLARLVEQGLHLITPLSGDALRATIQGPAAAAGLRLEPGLVDLLVRDTEHEPGALPLLSHALAETWARRDGRVLTVEGYRATGEIRGAVARTAEQLYQSLPAEQQSKLRSLLLRLIMPALDGEPTRSHIDRRLLSDDVDRAQVLDLLVGVRLVIVDGGHVELAHEALVRAWPRLRSWLDEDGAGQQLLRHLSATASGWDVLGRPDSELYRGARLNVALEWRATASPDLTDTETDFLDASLGAAESERVALARRAHRQSLQNRKLRWAVAGIAALLVVALVGGMVAIRQRERALDGQREAAADALIGQAVGLRSNRRDLAALLAVEAHRLAPGAASESALFGTFTSSPGVDRIVRTGGRISFGAGPTDAAYLPGGQTLALVDTYGAVQLIDLATGDIEQLAKLSPTSGSGSLELSAGGRFLAAGWRPTTDSPIGRVTVWDLETRQQRFSSIAIPFALVDLAIAQDGSTIAASGDSEHGTMIFDGTTGRVRAQLAPLSPPAEGDGGSDAEATFSPDGRLAVGSSSGSIRIVDPMTGEELQRIDSPPGTSEHFIAFNRDGTSMITAGSTGLNRYDVRSGTPLWAEPAPAKRCMSVAQAERAGLVLCGERSGRVRAFDLATGTEIGRRFDSQQGESCGLAIGPNQDRLAEVSSCLSGEVTIVEWRLDGGGPVSRLLTDAGGDRFVEQFGFQGTNALVAGWADKEGGDPLTHVLDTTDGHVVTTLPNVFGLLPTNDPDVAGVIYHDGKHPETLGRYNTRRRAPAGPQIDVGFIIGSWWTDGRLAIVRIGDGSRLRTVDLIAGRLVEPSIDLTDGVINDQIVDKDSLYTPVENYSDGRVEFRIQRRDLKTGAVVAQSEKGLTSLVASGGIVVAATPDGRLVELDNQSLEVIGRPFPSTHGLVSKLDIDDTGRRLMVRADDGTLRIYDIATRTQLGDPIETGDTIDRPSAALRGDGLAAATVTGDGIVAWDLDSTHWERAACRLAGRNLTRAEWDQYIGSLASYRKTCPEYTGGT